MTTRKQILKAIDCDKLTLWNGGGYWWFQYDDFKVTKRYDTHSVYVMTLSQLSLEQWVAEGKQFLDKVENKLK